MARAVVSSAFVWSDYPGLRAGRLYAGKPDLERRPNGAVHLVDGPGAVDTVCGMPRDGFPYEFPESAVPGKRAEPCAACFAGGLPG